MVDKKKFPDLLKSKLARSKKGAVVCDCKTLTTGKAASKELVLSGRCKCSITSGKNFKVNKSGGMSGFKKRRLGGVSDIFIRANKRKSLNS